MADSLNPWIQEYLNSVAQQFGANYTKAKRVNQVKVQLIKFLNLESRPKDGAVWARISDKKFSMPVMFTQAAIAAYVKKHKGPSSFMKLSTALVTLQEACLAFRPIPTGDKVGITDDYYLYLECCSFSISDQHQNDLIWKKPEDIMKNTKIKTYVEGLRRDGGGGNVYLEKRTQSQTRAMNKKFQDIPFERLPSPRSAEQPKSAKKTVREDPFWKDLNETNWNIKLQRAQATPSLTDSEEQTQTVTPARRKPEPAQVSTDQTESSQDDNSMSEASSSAASAPLTETDGDSSPTSSPSRSAPNLPVLVSLYFCHPRHPALPIPLITRRKNTKWRRSSQLPGDLYPLQSFQQATPVILLKPVLRNRGRLHLLSRYRQRKALSRNHLLRVVRTMTISSRGHLPAQLTSRFEKVPLPKMLRLSDSHQLGKSPRILVPNSDTSGIASQSQHLSTQESQSQPGWPPFPSQSQVHFSQLRQSSQRRDQTSLQRRSSHSQSSAASQREPKPLTPQGSLPPVSNQALETQDQSQAQSSPQISRSSRRGTRPSSPHDPLFSQDPNEEVQLQRHTHVGGQLSPTSGEGHTGSQSKEKFRAIKTASQGRSFGDSEEDDGDSLFSGDGDIAFSSDSPQSDGEASDVPAADGDSISVNLPGTQRDMDIDEGDEVSRASSAGPEVDMNVEDSSDSDVRMEQADQNDEIRDTVMKDATDGTASSDPPHLSQPKPLSEDDRQVNDDLFGDSGSHIGKAEAKYVLRSPRPPDANQKEALEHNREAWEQPTFMRQNIIRPSQSINPEKTSDAHPDESDLPAHNTPTARSGYSSMDGGKAKRRSEADRINVLKATQHPSGDIPSPSQMLEGSKLKGYTVNLLEKLKPSRMAGLLLRQNREE
ncbi:hypothetical protein BDZ89DRAFT_1056925 [Hymenopellis radicata]|nr:hypothetical protein BDZ89DRAFT_1056925 [Hymenopellis radicata]